jgi:hypothetical protein
MKKVSILCYLMLLGLLGHGFTVDAYAQLRKVTITSPRGTSIIGPRLEEYINGDSMDISWEDEHPVSGEDFWVRWASPTENYYNKKRFRVNATYKLRYSFDQITWENIPGEIAVCEYLWKVPVVEQSRRCWIKVIGFDAGGQKNDTDTRLVYIRAKPAVNVDISYSTNARLAGNWSGYYYSAPSGTIPVSGTIDSGNQYNFIGELPFGKAKFLGKFHGNCLDADDDGTLAITGDGTAYAPSGHVWSNDKSTATIDLDAETNAALTAMKGSWALGDDLVGSFAIDRE